MPSPMAVLVNSWLANHSDSESEHSLVGGERSNLLSFGEAVSDA